jgi:hypothetical protein
MNKPERKVAVGAFAGALVALITAILNRYILVDKPLPADITVLGTTVLTFFLQYFVPNSNNPPEELVSKK